MFTSEANGEKKINWPSIAIVIAAYLATALIQYGAWSQKMADIERRVGYMESQDYIPGPKGVTKDQFNEFQADILRRLIRIEDKQDTQIRRERLQ